ncbi:hypothetical protein GA0061102_1002302 [Rhizobium miluonense]|uniref:Oligopeptide/dipeptide transporter, C-terminal region n=2 Tax=Rhizobium/Agrobacterium group TaxID=227290 RepID=A0A1C3UBJ4_9HYPH|nr:hypothetical protein GA0061102_1002302 [Rhizobium miluonense]
MRWRKAWRRNLTSSRGSGRLPGLSAENSLLPSKAMQRSMRPISDDLGVICHICDDVAVTYRGKLVEAGPAVDIFERPQSDYTRMLLEAMLDPNPDRSPFRQTL